MLEDPAITRTMRTGYPYPECDEVPDPRCPCCGDICEKVFVSDGEIIGCDNCIEVRDASEERDCFGGMYEEI